MAEEKGAHKGGSGGGGPLFPIAILLLLVFVGFSRFDQLGGGFSGDRDSTISSPLGLGDIPSDQTISSPPPQSDEEDSSASSNGGGAPATETLSNDAPPYQPTPVQVPGPIGQTSRLSNEKIENKLASLYKKLDSLDAAVRELSLRSPVSPHANTVKLAAGSARSTDPLREYVTITANSKNASGVNISNWYLQSYVTEETVALPRGDRVLEKWRSPVLGDIFLDPGEQAKVFTAESPIDVSFRENLCTGYLAAERDFAPSLTQGCPRPLDDMEDFGEIDLDDDSCYDFVERLPRCKPLDEDAVDDADLSGACRRFLDTSIGHNECVARHRYDPFFDNPGGWRVYLDHDEDLWRAEREIIRLMDENDLVIGYIEY